MKNNLEAVKEVVRQLRLRDIGGIIVIDFIDMANPKNRATVEEALRSELERDRTKTYVVEISPLGLVEMTRQNVTDGPREILTTKCVVCAGDGFVVSEATHALEIERKLREIAKGARAQAFRIAVHPRVLALLAGPGGRRLQEIEAAARRRFFLVPAAAENGHVHLDHFEVLEQGKLEALKPTAAVEEGASLELKLVEVGLYDPTAGVGKVDGSEIVVAGAAKLVGKKVAGRRVGRVLDGVAYATLADSPEAATPITFEAEAEKPTRAPSRRKASPRSPARGTARRADGGGRPSSKPTPSWTRSPSRRTRSPRTPAVAEARRRPARRRRRSAPAAERAAGEAARSPRPPRPRKTPRRGDAEERRTEADAEDPRSVARSRCRAASPSAEPAPEPEAAAEARRGGRRPQRTASRSESAHVEARVEAASARSPRRTAAGEASCRAEDGATPSRGRAREAVGRRGRERRRRTARRVRARCRSGSRTSTRAREVANGSPEGPLVAIMLRFAGVRARVSYARRQT